MKYYESPRWTNEFLDCSMPMTFDTYNKCSFNCLYCFSFFQKIRENSPNAKKKFRNYQKSELKQVDVERIKKIFTLQKKSQFEELIKNKVVMQVGGLADAFDYYEKQKGVTLELLKFFDEIDYPLSFSTKSDWFVYDKRYTDIIKKHPHNWHFKISIINLDEVRAKKLEVGVPSPERRLEVIKRLSEMGINVTLRLRPFILGFSDINDEYLKLIEKAKENGANSVSTEFLCIEGRADSYLKERYKVISRIVGYDVLSFYKKHSTSCGYLRLNYNLKKPYIDKMEKKCKELGLRFYVSDAHHKEKCHNGSCCGLPCSFNYSRGQYTEALMIAKEKGYVRFSDIEPFMEHFKKVPWGKAEGLNTTSNEKRLNFENFTLFDYFKYKWNTPNNPNSPYKYFSGVLYPDGIDEEGNVIYKYSGEKLK